MAAFRGRRAHLRVDNVGLSGQLVGSPLGPRRKKRAEVAVPQLVSPSEWAFGADYGVAPTDVRK